MQSTFPEASMVFCSFFAACFLPPYILYNKVIKSTHNVLTLLTLTHLVAFPYADRPRSMSTFVPFFFFGF